MTSRAHKATWVPWSALRSVGGPCFTAAPGKVGAVRSWLRFPTGQAYDPLVQLSRLRLWWSYKWRGNFAHWFWVLACFSSFSLGVLFDPDDGRDILLRNIGLSPKYTALQPRRPMDSINLPTCLLTTGLPPVAVAIQWISYIHSTRSQATDLLLAYSYFRIRQVPQFQRYYIEK
jgi:hypothetical protein